MSEPTSPAHTLRAPIGPFPGTTFGAGSIDELPEHVAQSTAARGRHDRAPVLIVTDQGLRGSALMGRIAELVSAPGRAVAVFDAIRSNPTTTDLSAGAARAREHEADLLVAVGGGSALDAAKGIALAATNPGPDVDLTWGSGGSRAPALPIVCVPTTAGTGSEVNDYGVVTDVRRHRKFYVGDPSCLASAVILDPVLTLTLPPAPTAACGLDCLTHAVESFTSVRANPWADVLDLRVIEVVRRWLPRAVADGSDLRARSAMLLAAHTAGQAMSSTGLGIVHAIGHPLGGRHDLPHGTALALVLAACLRFNEPASGARLARIAEALGVHHPGASQRRNAAAAIDSIEALVHTVGASGRLGDHGITREHLAPIADDALADAVLHNTPRRPTTGDVRSILEEVL